VATCAVQVFVRLRSSVAVALAFGNRADEQGADARQKDQAEHVAMLPERGGIDFEVEEDVLAEQPGAPVTNANRPRIADIATSVSRISVMWRSFPALSVTGQA
jgi:hypothetical protein